MRAVDFSSLVKCELDLAALRTATSSLREAADSRLFLLSLSTDSFNCTTGLLGCWITGSGLVWSLCFCFRCYHLLLLLRNTGDSGCERDQFHNVKVSHCFNFAMTTVHPLLFYCVCLPPCRNGYGEGPYPLHRCCFLLVVGKYEIYLLLRNLFIITIRVSFS